ncbi:MAG: tRNA (N6-isopentenyl adenosine(37)-C2)-methylthiotransferase MiaB, partial [Proteobacteria bacterium]|nr:tRNA (N6-isopentenyl adenosine(37)-C2)-methylthiotransferase MiaB [Pseudomonadota bacterium]
IGELKVTKDQRPEMIIAVGGCMAQMQGDEIKERFPYVDVVFGTHQWTKLPEMIDQASKDGKNFHTQQVEVDFENWKNYSFLPFHESDTPHKARENVTIQNGCNNFCTFCLVPFTRGREVSRPIGEILDEIQKLASRGVREVNLLGQNVNAYGSDKRGEPQFVDLLDRVAEIDGIERIRFVTSHPAVMTTEMIDRLAANPKVCEHIHLPIQSGSNRVLDLMQRGYHIEKYRELVHHFKKRMPNMMLTTDIIVAFPGETEEDFQETLKVVEEFDYNESYSFIYSPRMNTKAAKWTEQFIPDEVAKDRLYRLKALQRKIKDRHSKEYLGKTVEVLVESAEDRGGETMVTGRTRTFQTVNFLGDKQFLCNLKSVKITGTYTYSLQGILEPVSEVTLPVNS